MDSSFRAIVLTHWRAPFTGGHDAILPEGLVVFVNQRPAKTAEGLSVLPIEQSVWEKGLVPEEDRTAAKYAGYSIIITKANLAKNCSLVEQRRSAN